MYTVKGLSGWLLCTILLTAGCAHGTDLPSMQARYAELKQADEASFGKPDLDRSRAIAAAYERLFADMSSAPTLAALSDADLDIAFNAADITAFYTFAGTHAEEMARTLAELERRGLAKDEHYQSLRGAFVQARMFDDAIALQAKRPSLDPLPLLHRDGDYPHAIWRVHPNRNELTLQSSEIEARPMIVMVAHPGCHFSQDAVRAIEADPELRTLFEQHAILLAPPARSFEVPRMQQWNRAHPAMPMLLAHGRDAWPQFASWGTPTFYFLRDGELQSTVNGWPKDGKREEVLAAARSIGLTP